MANKFYFDGIETSCTRIARNMCGPDEYAVTINDNDTEYEVLLLAGPFGTDEQICADGYAQWRKEHPTNPDNTPAAMNANETTYKVTISNESHNYTDTKHNAILTGFASVETASKAAKEAARDIAGELAPAKIIYSETLNAFAVVNPNSGAWLIVAKVEEDSSPVKPTAKRITVKRSEWNETAKRLECSGWYYIGTPTATGKTIYRRGNSEVEIIIEEDTTAPEFSELSHAGQCLDIYLHNTAEIYERYTVPAIERVTRAIKAGEYVSDTAEQLAKDVQEIAPALQAAARLVNKYDHITPTAQDIEQVTHNYAAYIVDCAEYEIEK